MSRDEAIRLMQAMDELGFHYTLDASGDASNRGYAFDVNLDGFGVQRLPEVENAVDQVVPKAFTKVERGYLSIS